MPQGGRRCVVRDCTFVVNESKHTCEYCGGAVCKVHRERRGGMFSKKYYCNPPCGARLEHEGVWVGSDPQPTSPAGVGVNSSNSSPNGAVQVGSPISMQVQRGGTYSMSPPQQQRPVPPPAGPTDARFHAQGGGSPNPPPYPGSSPQYQGAAGGSPNPPAPSPNVLPPYPSSTAQYQYQGPAGGSPNPPTQYQGPAGAMLSPNPGQQGRPSSANSPFYPDRPPSGRTPLQGPQNSSFGGSTPATRQTPPPSAGRSFGNSSFGGEWIPFPIPPPATERNTRLLRIGTQEGKAGPSSPTVPPVEVSCSPTVFQKASISSTGLAELPNQAGYMVRGIVLGELPDGQLVWHQRGREWPCIIPPDKAPFLVSFRCARCKHCGIVIPLDESTAHVATHTKSATPGGSNSGRTLVDTHYGTCCGDVELLTSLIRRRKLGAGAQGSVWLCDRVSEDLNARLAVSDESGPKSKPKERFVLKEILCQTEPEAQSRYQQSVRFMNLKHDHLIRYCAVQLQPDKTTVGVVMPYYADQDLIKLIRNAKRFEEDYIGSIMLQLSIALKYLHGHKPPIIHGDIKPDNILMFNKKNQVLLMDLDTSVELIGSATGGPLAHHSDKGTTEWMAPETLHHHVASPASDIWSLGLLLFVLTTLPDFAMLADSNGEEQLLNAKRWEEEEETQKQGNQEDFAMKVQNSILSRGYTTGLARLTSAMLNHNPSRRPTASQVEEFLTELLTAQLTGGA